MQRLKHFIYTLTLLTLFNMQTYAMDMSPTNTISSIKLDVYKISNVNDHKVVNIKMQEATSHKPVTLDMLKTVHTQKIHLLIIDESLQDFSHKHVTALKTPGEYKFNWKPKHLSSNYLLWADVWPLNTDKQEYVPTRIILVNATAAKPQIDRTVIMHSTIDGYNFKLSFSTDKLHVAEPVIGTIMITDSQGKPITTVEPLMGAFAHIVGFSENLNTVTHGHPIGEEPINATDRAGPELNFHFEPTTIGFVKLFVHLKINGQELYVPFGIVVTK